MPASAQSVDLAAELRQVDHEVLGNRDDVDRLERQINRCQDVDPDAVVALATTANELSQRAAAIAPQVPGRQHVLALNVQSIAETNFWRLMHPPVAEQCYVPPVEE
jgi:hypothetical protein